jgi:hypothetical protein
MYYRSVLLACASILVCSGVFAQFPDAAGMPGSTAIKYDSSSIIGWATQCVVARGLADIQVPENGYASYGEAENATGSSDGNPLSSISLGDKGVATVSFAQPFGDKPGNDFAVFENSFSDDFLELALVSVSSDGDSFYTFPSYSLSDTLTQIGTFGILNPTKIHNLAGKYRAGFGTPFDLNELSHILSLDIQHITHVRITDVCGSINPLYATRDVENRIINDPYPTPFNTSGFDLDGVAIVSTPASGNPNIMDQSIRFGPNPATRLLLVTFPEPTSGSYVISTLLGNAVSAGNLINGTNEISLAHIPNGIYCITVNTTTTRFVKTFIKR